MAEREQRRDRRDRDETPFFSTDGNREYAVDSEGTPFFGEKNFRGWPYR